MKFGLTSCKVEVIYNRSACSKIKFASLGHGEELSDSVTQRSLLNEFLLLREDSAPRCCIPGAPMM